MRISDWSSDVCSSDLFRLNPFAIDPQLPRARPARNGGKAHQRQVTLEPAVEPYPVVVGGDGKLADLLRFGRSEERRVGKECGSTCRSGWWPLHEKKRPNSYILTLIYNITKKHK